MAAIGPRSKPGKDVNASQQVCNDQASFKHTDHGHNHEAIVKDKPYSIHETYCGDDEAHSGDDELSLMDGRRPSDGGDDPWPSDEKHKDDHGGRRGHHNLSRCIVSLYVSEYSPMS